LQKRNEVLGRISSDLLERQIRIAECVRTVGKTGSISVKYEMPYTFYFSIYIGKRLTTPSASTY